MNHICEPGTPPVTLRNVTAQDHEFLFCVYASTREAELAQVPWPPAQKEHFLRSQFHAQRRCYETDYPGAEFQIITVADQPAGRFYLQRRPREIRIMDIALLPAFRNRGIGTHLINSVLADAARTQRLVTIHAEVFNPALRLYERLGFVKAALNGIYYLLECRPESSPGAPALETLSSNGSHEHLQPVFPPTHAHPL